MTLSDIACRSCGSTVLETIADLGSQPAADLFPAVDDPGPDATWPLILAQCRDCLLLQTPDVEGPAPEVPLATSSDWVEEESARRVRGLTAMMASHERVVVREFCSPHGGSWLPALCAEGWTAAAGDEKADVVVDVQGLVHEGDLDAALRHRTELVAAGGLYVVEFHHALGIVRDGQFDLVRHGHPVYLSLLAFGPALARHGFVMLHAEKLTIYGGSLLLVCGRSGAPDESIERILAEESEAGLDDIERLAVLGSTAADASEALHEWLREQRAAGRVVLGYGAASKAPALLNRARVDPELLPFVADRAPAKWGRRMPVTRIPIKAPSDLVAAEPDIVLILAWDVASEVRSQLTESGLACTYYVPIPIPTAVP